MESVSKNSGKVFKGKLGALMHRIGVANAVDGSEPPKKKAPPVKKVNKPKAPKAPKAPRQPKEKK